MTTPTRTAVEFSRNITMRQLADVALAKGRQAWDAGEDDIAHRCEAAARELEAAADLYDRDDDGRPHGWNPSPWGD
jgi:hypothetical protein